MDALKARLDEMHPPICLFYLLTPNLSLQYRVKPIVIRSSISALDVDILGTVKHAVGKHASRLGEAVWPRDRRVYHIINEMYVLPDITATFATLRVIFPDAASCCS